MKRFNFIAFLALLTPFAVQADYSYSWFEVGYIGDAEQETTTGTETGDGLDIRLNFLAGDHLFFTGYVDEVKSDGSKQDLDSFGLGIGIHNDFSAKLGMFATLTYEDIETPMKDDDGLGLTAGLRYNVQDDFEAYGGVKLASYAHTEGLFLHIGGVWAFSENYAMVAEYSEGEYEFDKIDGELEREQVRLALRVQF